MLTSRKWLSQYLDLSNYRIEGLATKITAAGLEVEGIDRLAQGTNLIIGEVLACKPHPDSDHLNVCDVDIKDEVLQIVCGAPNVRQGLKVIVAQVGAILPELTIKAGTIRGVVSNGMICSLLELGVSDKLLNDQQKQGIEELSQDAQVGSKDVLAYLGLDDERLDISLTPNRNDCLAAFAMAMETGAILNQKASLPEFEGASKIGSPTKWSVKTQSANCSFYQVKAIGQLVVKESPTWIKQLLQASGMKSINNVVDISNLVMLETGQPLHFFDASKLACKQIVVKDDIQGDYVALDQQSYAIQHGDVMITCNDACIAIGGVMGGDDSKIDESTSSILIEAASFDRVNIRNTSRRLNITSDASIRYQKGIEPLAPFKAMDRAVDLLIRYADATLMEETVQSSDFVFTPTMVSVSCTSINKLLGTTFASSEVFDVLERLEFSPKQDGDCIQVTIPSYRQDIAIEADIAEEVIRILGFDDLPSTLPTLISTSAGLNKRQKTRRVLREFFTNQGLFEALTYTLISESLKNDAVVSLGETLVLASPMSEDRKYIRESILPSLLASAAFNVARSMKRIALFEISQVYAKDVQQEHLAITLSGPLQLSRWQNIQIDCDFYTIKGMLITMLEKLGFSGSRVLLKENTQQTTLFHPYQSASLYIGRDLFAIFGRIHPQHAKNIGVDDKTVMAECNLEVILSNKTSKLKFEPVSKYPAIARDIAMVVDKKVLVGDLIQTIKQVGKQVVHHVEVFDVYEGDNIQPNTKSIALSIVFQSKERTLTDDEMSGLMNQILTSLASKHQAQLRS